MDGRKRHVLHQSREEGHGRLKGEKFLNKTMLTIYKDSGPSHARLLGPKLVVSKRGTHYWKGKGYEKGLQRGGTKVIQQ